MFSSIPKDWKRVPLSSVSERMKRRNSAGNTNVLTISAVHGLVNQKDFFNKIVASDNLSNYFHLKKGDFAYNKSYSHGYPVGVVRRLEMYDEGVLSPLYICFSMKGEGVDDKFAVYFFDSHWFVEEVNEIAKEGARNHGLLNVGVGDFFDLDFVLPPLPEQQKIAAILSSVDDVIEKTRAQIDKLKDLKTGMMQELLTKGIGHTAFKPLPKWRVGKIAEIGQIPRSWELVDMASIAKLESGHTPSRNVDEYWGGDIQWLSLHDIKNLSNPVIKSTVYTVTQDGIDNSSARVLPKNTVALSRTASVGNCVMLGEDMATSQDFANYVCGDELYPKYLLHLFRWMQHVWSNLSEGSTHKTIYMPVFKKLQILLPPFDEQERIAEAADKIETNIVAKQKRLEGFQLVKKALMQDLLTGKVRVNVDNKENAVA
ncbi:restriction endonuclease subunit S [Alloalcanivorax xenomutans]|uniref:restriction endonuclease subunit S n=1 Tax=Alloalcanivorax xenomutans TaxID=1094342 RepID=UPI003BACABD5